MKYKVTIVTKETIVSEYELTIDSKNEESAKMEGYALLEYLKKKGKVDRNCYKGSMKDYDYNVYAQLEKGEE